MHASLLQVVEMMTGNFSVIDPFGPVDQRKTEPLMRRVNEWLTTTASFCPQLQPVSIEQDFLTEREKQHSGIAVLQVSHYS